MPTKHPRRAITETPEVKLALDSLRAATGESNPSLAELIVLGARVKAETVLAGRERDDASISRLAAMVRSRSIPVEIDAADRVKHLRLDS